MRIVTWNVNGIRNPFSYSPWSTSRSYKTIFETLRADIIVLQELKMQRKDLTSQIAHVPGYESFFTFPKAKKGYSGVAVYVNTEKCMPIKAEEGITGCLENDKRIPWRELNGGIGGYSGIDLLEGQFLDSEGRALILDFGMFVLIGIYCPNNSGPEREDYRLQYLDSLSRRVGNLIAAGRQVIVAGDVNVCCSLLDTADPKEALRVSENGDFMSNPGRQWLGAFLKSCVKDVVREFWPEREGMFTCWNTKINARPGNYGSRIDYILITERLIQWTDKADIQSEIYGSDHCPVFIELKLKHDNQYLLDNLNSPGIFVKNIRFLENPCPPRFAARYYCEFSTKNIKTMFANLPATTVKDTIENISQKGSTTLTSAPPGSVKRKGSPLNVHAKPKKEKVKSDRQKPITKFLTGKKRTSSNSDDNPPSKSYAVSETALSDLDLYPLPESTNSSHFPDQSLSELIQTSRKSQTSSSRTWSEIFTKPVPPNCTTHDEPCIQLVVKKPGLNCGRKFWICSRDVGPGYDNWSRPKDDIDERFRCGFFKWCNGN